MRLAEPGWLVLLLLLPLPWLRERRRSRLSWPTLSGFGKAPRAAAGWPSRVPLVLRSLALGCLVVAMARPVSVGGRTWIAGRGVAIVVALDRSGSMETADFPEKDEDQDAWISRLEAARRTVTAFVRGRPDDLIGLVVFANEPDLACPLTLDHRLLLEAVASVEPARAGEDGTNLGDAVAEALGALRQASPSRKVVILITDGQDRPAMTNPRPMTAEAAAELSKGLGITLHTINLGGGGSTTDSGDGNLLQKMAREGGGRAFEAGDETALNAVFQELDTLERSPVTGRVFTRYREEFAPWVGAALGLLALEVILRRTRLRTLP